MRANERIEEELRGEKTEMNGEEITREARRGDKRRCHNRNYKIGEERTG